MPDFKEHQSELRNKGYTIVDTQFLNEELNNIRNEFYRVNSVFSEKLGGGSIHSDEDIMSFHKNYGPQQFNVWKVFQFDPVLYRVTGNQQLLDTLANIGLTLPTLDLAPQLRCDMPIPGQSIFLRHQDYSYNIGSDDAVTMWTPLQDTRKEQGCLLVVPGSHKNGIYSHSNGIISDEIKFEFISQEVLFGQTLFFDQKLVHQSGFNSSNNIRFSLQIRYSNLESKAYLDRDWYKNHKSVVQQFA